MPRAALEALLKETMGLDVESVGAASIDRALRERVTACGLADLQAYWEHASSSAAELQELIESVVVSETWFFRDAEAFTALTRMVREQWIAANPEGVLRILSLPCATGEEPFSIAMSLLDAGLAPERFCIDAVDISVRALAMAERGIYGKNSFRSRDLSFRDRYFERVGQGYRIGNHVRRSIRFQQGNLLQSGWLPGASGYDAIFCRNVLIYFDRPTQEQALRVLMRLMLPNALMFVGPSETALLLDHGFVSEQMPLAFAFRRGKVASRRSASMSSTVTSIAPIWRMLLPARTHAPKNARSADTPAKRETPSLFQEAQRLADQGKLEEALQCCERHVRESSSSPEAFYLMGLLHDAAGKAQSAAEHYRKVLYLDPTHHEALVHLAVILQKQGDARAAQLLMDRAKRSAAGNGGPRNGN